MSAVTLMFEFSILSFQCFSIYCSRCPSEYFDSLMRWEGSLFPDLKLAVAEIWLWHSQEEVALGARGLHYSI